MNRVLGVLVTSAACGFAAVAASVATLGFVWWLWAWWAVLAAVTVTLLLSARSLERAASC
ncbi:hypothetical protein HDA32_003201 [Spinactinospora alkalitolerans]|uniref:Uncharacterized protein n=1 Tax=Spinactinospora alkalitolerans TaxID=687207 RepID=A0A852TWH1_9ACTN|nr:hypothetical protein [Spinactinospora alkalitolerans]NYE48081.1 hypothetical protein [Spinactinospora alkalitolerans]